MNRAYDIVFEDEYLVVLNKIAKILIQPSPKKEKHTLTSLLEADLGKKVYPCHRLDRQTSGLIIYAKTKDCQKEVAEQFKERKVKKKYIAFIKGCPPNKKGILEDFIIDKEGEKFKEKPKKARTFYRVLTDYRSWSKIQLEPLTGRTNQLRIQLAKISHPILGEDKYAFRKDFKVRFKRLALHAFYLNFTHPISKDKVNLEIPLAQDMKAFSKKY